MIEYISKESFKKIKLLSKHNNLIKRNLIIEGERLITQIIDNIIKFKLDNVKIIKFLLTENKINFYYEKKVLQSLPVFFISEKQSNELSENKSNQGLFMEIEFSILPINNFNKILFLNNISDPGNLGSIIRCALSFGIDGVVLDSGCCSIYNSKVIRSSMGAIFYQPMLLTETNWLMDRKEEIIETTNKGEISLYNYSFPSSPFILVLGNEANGVSNSISNLSSKKIYIPMKPGMESINVAIAAGIFLYKISMS